MNVEVTKYGPRYRDELLAVMRACNQRRNAEAIERTGRVPEGTYVAVSDGGVVGFVEANFSDAYSEQYGLETAHPDPQMTIASLYVHPDRRGNGIGPVLLRAMLVEGQYRGRSYATLYPDSGDGFGRRVAFFEREGFGWLDEENRIMGAPITTLLEAAGEAL